MAVRICMVAYKAVISVFKIDRNWIWYATAAQALSSRNLIRFSFDHIQIFFLPSFDVSWLHK